MRRLLNRCAFAFGFNAGNSSYSGFGAMLLVVFATMTTIVLLSLQTLSGTTLIHLSKAGSNNISAEMIARGGLQAVRADIQSKLDNNETVDETYRYPETPGTYNNVTVPDDPDDLTGGKSVVGQYSARVLKARGTFYLVEITGLMNNTQVTFTEILRLKSNTVAVRNGVRFLGRANGDQIGDVTRVGDVNNDGFDDFVIGAPFDSPNEAGEVYLIFGRSAQDWDSLVDSTGTFNLDDISNGNKMIRFTARNAQDDWLGLAISGVGDLDNDGYDDFALGAIKAPNDAWAGEVYVIFGRPTNDGTSNDWESFTDASGNFSLSNTSWTNKKTIRFYSNGSPVWSMGDDVAGADVDQDGYSDLIIGITDRDSSSIGGGPSRGEVLIVFGRSTSDWGSFVNASGNYNVSTRQKSHKVLSLIGGTNNIQAGLLSYGKLGDVNNDGYPDLLIGAPGKYFSGQKTCAVYLVFGRAWSDWNSLTNASGNYILPAVGSNASEANRVFRFDSKSNAQSYTAGWSVSNGGDLDNDGYDDIVIGAFRSSEAGGNEAGEIYVIFGRAWDDGTSDDWESFFTNGLFSLSSISVANKTAVFVGESSGQAGYSAKIAGDVNNDGIDDLLIGAPIEYTGDTGITYLVMGRSWTDWTTLINSSASFTLTTSTKAKKIIRFRGKSSGDRQGDYCNGAGDVNGDGIDDFLITSTQADSGHTDNGNVFLIFGRKQSEFDEWVGTDGLFNVDTNW